MDRKATHSVRLEAMLALRGWAHRALLLGEVVSPPSCRAEEWSLFLLLERCAVALQQAAGTRLGTEDRNLLTAFARAELARVLSARSELRSLGVAAQEAGWRVVVLKGAAEPINAPPVDLLDLDILLPPIDLHAVTMWFANRGYGLEPDSHAVHAVPPKQAGGVTVDIHTTLREWDYDVTSAVPAPDAPGALRMAPADHVWHLLLHSGLMHPDRRGCLRDLLLLRQAWNRCSEGEQERVQHFARCHAQQIAFEEMLAQTKLEASDVFELATARRYSAWQFFGTDQSNSLLTSLTIAVVKQLAADVGIPASHGQRRVASPIGVVRALEMRVPAAAPVLRTAGGIIRRALATVIALYLRSKAQRAIMRCRRAEGIADDVPSNSRQRA